MAYLYASVCALFLYGSKIQKAPSGRELPRNEGEGERVQGGFDVFTVEHLHHLCRNLLHRFAEPPLGGSLTLDLGRGRRALPAEIFCFDNGRMRGANRCFCESNPLSKYLSQNKPPSSPKQIYGEALKIIKIFLSYCIEGFFMV